MSKEMQYKFKWGVKELSNDKAQGRDMPDCSSEC